jgi:hypothetical protein
VIFLVGFFFGVPEKRRNQLSALHTPAHLVFDAAFTLVQLGIALGLAAHGERHRALGDQRDKRERNHHEQAKEPARTAHDAPAHHEVISLH